MYRPWVMLTFALSLWIPSLKFGLRAVILIDVACLLGPSRRTHFHSHLSQFITLIFMSFNTPGKALLNKVWNKQDILKCNSYSNTERYRTICTYTTNELQKFTSVICLNTICIATLRDDCTTWWKVARGIIQTTIMDSQVLPNQLSTCLFVFILQALTVHWDTTQSPMYSLAACLFLLLHLLGRISHLWKIQSPFSLVLGNPTVHHFQRSSQHKISLTSNLQLCVGMPVEAKDKLTMQTFTKGTTHQ